MAYYSKLKTIVGKQSLSVTPVEIVVGRKAIMFHALSGNIFIRHDGVAGDNADSFKLSAGGVSAVELEDVAVLSVVSDATGAMYQYMIMES
jgi:hypothetical protein